MNPIFREAARIGYQQGRAAIQHGECDIVSTPEDRGLSVVRASARIASQRYLRQSPAHADLDPADQAYLRAIFQRTFAIGALDAVMERNQQRELK